MLCVIISHKLPFNGEHFLWPSSALTVKFASLARQLLTFLISALPFLSVLPYGIQNTLVTKETNFTLPAGSLNASESNRMCDYLIWIRLGVANSHAEHNKYWI